MPNFFAQQDVVLTIALKVFMLAFVLPLHNIVQVLVASAFGDDTGKKAGMLSLNPMVHVNFRSIITCFLFGFASTTTVPRRFTTQENKKPFFAHAITTLSGPFTYLLIALISILTTGVIWKTTGVLPINWVMQGRFTGLQLFVSCLVVLAYLCIQLFFVSLIPLPMFDGWVLLLILLPLSAQGKIIKFFRKYEGIITVLGILLLIPIVFFLIDSLTMATQAYFYKIMIKLFA